MNDLYGFGRCARELGVAAVSLSAQSSCCGDDDVAWVVFVFVAGSGFDDAGCFDTEGPGERYSADGG